MKIQHVVAAADESEAGREAVRAAVGLAARTSARVTVMRAVPAPHVVPAGPLHGLSEWDANDVERLQRWVEADHPPSGRRPLISYGVACGLAGVEIGRYAERHHADLVVLGRKRRSLKLRLAVGDTADAVARRSLVPCLFVPIAAPPLRRVLVAVGGFQRGMTVVTAAMDFARQAGAELTAVTVETEHPDEPAHLRGTVQAALSVRLQESVRAVMGETLDVRRGDAVEQVLAAVDERGADTLVIGCHRGGPPGIIDAGSTARRLAHTAPCTVLTVPL
ncbi:MAG TPA: universal stress protein [Gemmatimonadales bacterium]|nr:universal stress protein [Gemmatimonadales bacterium]